MRVPVKPKDAFSKFKQSKMEQVGFTSDKAKQKIQNK